MSGDSDADLERFDGEPSGVGQGVPPEHHDAEVEAAEPAWVRSPAAATEVNPVDNTAPEVDPEEAHAKFLETYEAVLTRHPQALADERAAQDAIEAEERARLEQEQAERDEVTRRQLEAQAQADAEVEAYKREHFPGT